MSNNKCYLYGTILETPTFSHEIYGENFYDTFLSVSRLSGQCDVIPITISDRLLSTHNLKVGDKIAVLGQYRSYNKYVDNKSKLLLKMFVREIIPEAPLSTTNFIELSGYVCKEPIYRTTPFKREICDLLVAVNRAYNKSDYIPCIAWGRNARFAKSIEVGQKVYLHGRIQSREYQKKVGEEMLSLTAYEISLTNFSLEKLNSPFIQQLSTTPLNEPQAIIPQLKIQNA